MTGQDRTNAHKTHKMRQKYRVRYTGKSENRRDRGREREIGRRWLDLQRLRCGDHVFSVFTCAEHCAHTHTHALKYIHITSDHLMDAHIQPNQHSTAQVDTRTVHRRLNTGIHIHSWQQWSCYTIPVHNGIGIGGSSSLNSSSAPIGWKAHAH